jgi:hypothetical protein
MLERASGTRERTAKKDEDGGGERDPNRDRKAERKPMPERTPNR